MPARLSCRATDAEIVGKVPIGPFPTLETASSTDVSIYVNGKVGVPHSP
jgi:hypothetical protein